MNRRIAGFLYLFFALGFLAACSQPTESGATTSQIPASTATITASPTRTPSPTQTPWPTATISVAEGTPVPGGQSVIGPDNMDQLVELAHWGYGAIGNFLPLFERNLMVIQTEDWLRVYHYGTQELVWEESSTSAITAAAMAPDGISLAYGNETGTLIFRNVVDGSLITSWQAYDAAVVDLAYSSNGQLLATCDEKGQLRVWDVFLEEMIFDSSLQYVSSDLAFVNNDQFLAVISWNGAVYEVYALVNLSERTLIHPQFDADAMLAWDVKSNRFVQLGIRSAVYDFYGRKISELYDYPLDFTNWGPFDSQFSEDGSLVAAGLESGKVAVWDVETGAVAALLDVEPSRAYWGAKRAMPALRTGPGPETIYGLGISSDNKYLVGMNGYHEFFVWNIQTKQLVKKGSGLGGDIYLSPDNQSMVAVGPYVFETYTFPSLERTASWPLLSCGTGRFSPEGETLACGSYLWDLASGEEKRLPYGEYVIGFANNGQTVFTKGRKWWIGQRDQNDLRLMSEVNLDYSTKENEWFYGENGWSNLGGWFTSPDGRYAYASAYESPMYIWDLASGQRLDEAYMLIAVVIDGQFSNDGKFLFIYSAYSPSMSLFEYQEGNATLVDTFDLAENTSFRLAGNGVAFVLSADNSQILVLVDNQLLIIDVQTEKLVETQALSFLNKYSSFTTFVQSPINELLVFAAGEQLIYYDPDSHEVLKIVDTHSSHNGLVFSPDGRYLAVKQDDGLVHLYGASPAQ